jgi:hypothetical protein
VLHAIPKERNLSNFINQAGKSVIDYAVVSEGLINNLVEFKIGNEIISSHMPLLIEIGNIMQRKASTKAIVEKTAHKLLKSRWDERVNSEFLDITNSNINEYCMYRIKLLLQNGKINEAQNILLFSLRRAGAKMRCDGKKYRKKEHRFDEECTEKKREAKEALRKFKEKVDDESRIAYWEKRKAYEIPVEKKSCIWQEKEAECINKLVREKEMKKIWEAIRNITRKKETTVFVEPREWISYFQELFSINNDRMLVDLYETQTLGRLYIAELDNDFTKAEVKDFIRSMKNNKATSYDGIPAGFWKIFCTVRDGIKILTNMFNKIKNGKEFPLDWKISIIHPIYKAKGNREKPGNYRIYLLSICGKIFSRILDRRLRDWLINDKILSRSQAGFIKVKRTTELFL